MVTFRLPSEVADAMREHAQETGISQTRFVEEAVRRLLKHHESADGLLSPETLRGLAREPDALPVESGADEIEVLYDELLGQAKRTLRTLPPWHSLEPDDLVAEMWLKLSGRDLGEGRTWRSKAHFLATAARAMRRILIDHARDQGAGRRKARRERVALDSVTAAYVDRGIDLIELDEALKKLKDKLGPRVAQIAELLFFGGLQTRDVAENLNIPLRTVERDWFRARAYLRKLLTGSEENRSA